MTTRLSSSIGARVFYLALVISVSMLFSVISCDGSNGPVAPANMGLAFQQSPPSGNQCSRQETTISWKVNPQLAHMFESFKVCYSVDSGIHWLLIIETSRTRINWVVPSGIDSNDCLIKVEGCFDLSVPIAEIISDRFSIVSFSDPVDLIINSVSEVGLGEEIIIRVIRKDEYGNNVPVMPLAIMVNWGDGSDTTIMNSVETDGTILFCHRYFVPGAYTITVMTDVLSGERTIYVD